MKRFLIFLMLVPPLAQADEIIERRNWIENSIKPLQEELCMPEVKLWHCLFPERAQCSKVLKEFFTTSCSTAIVPDLPEYIDGPETKAKANKVVTDCLTTELTKKYILPLSHSKMDEFSECTGAVPRSKPMNPYLVKALEFSKSQTMSTCAADGFMQKCFTLSEAACNEILQRQQLDCTMNMEKEGVAPKDDLAAQDSGRKATDCALSKMRTLLTATHKRAKDKDCE
jgi:hypothetical protein